MNEDTPSKKVDYKNLPVSMYWHNGPPTERVRKEDFAKRRPKMSKRVSVEWLKDPTRHLLKTKEADTRAKGNDRDDQAEK